ncbi:MAG TPA: pyridoxamine 5'-phosphate oxidase [Pyrinomonadaceae bacterium]
MEKRDLADLRREYSLRELSKASVAADPFVQFANWFDENLASQPAEPSAVLLSTVGSDGAPSSRVVLLKGFDARGFVFYSNYESKKGRDIAAEPRTSLTFFWPELERQVHIAGRTEKVSREESESYFKSRPVASKLGAWASEQSTELSSREALEDRLREVTERFAGQDVPCPPFWGGYRIIPTRFEFWQGRPSRLHDRICYELRNDEWKISRLSP